MTTHVPSGIGCYGDLAWGDHLCHLYETREDLTDTLVPFFAAGLADNERCLWVTAPPLPADEARAALAACVPDLAGYVARGQIQIVDSGDWHTWGATFDADALLARWFAAEQDALAAGYPGLRATGNAIFLQSRASWREFERFEARVNDLLVGRKVLALCSYRLESSSGSDVLDVVRNHQFAVVRRHGEWEMVESAELTVAKHALQAHNIELEERVANRTGELRDALASVEARGRQLEAELARREEAERQLAAELADARLLRDISATIVDEGDVDALYQKLLDAAAAIMRSDFASMQAFHAERGDGELRLLAHIGFSEDAVRFWTWVRPDHGCTCARALVSRRRAVAADIETCEQLAGSEDLAMFRRAGVRAMQTTPLLSRSGALVGMISTYWRVPHEPTERDLRMFEILVRQAADLIERNRRTMELADASRYKDEFLATLAHELRNPLAPLRTGLSVLHTRKLDALERVVPMMERQLGQMVRLVDDLLDVSRVSRGKLMLQKDRVALRAVIDNAIETSRPLLEAGRHRFDLTLPGNPLWLDADATRLAQVISNVLNNAAKYTPDGGHIHLVADRDDTTITIRIADTGIGIARDMLAKVFDLFTQVAHAAERARGGLGIGLSLARMLVELHDGTITVDSDGPGHGSTFTIRLPLAPPRPDTVPPAPHGSAVPHTIASQRILVVDDNRDAAEVLAMLLEDAGHTTRVVIDSPSAVGAALAFHPDLVFLDLGMPELSGYDVARLLRQHRELDRAMLVALTGWGGEDDRQRSRSAGFDHHLTKPVLTSALADVLVRVRSRSS